MADYDYYDLVTSQGLIVPDTAEIKKDVEAVFKEVFGAELDVSPATPQGRLIEVNALSRINTVRFNALVANQINPNVATGAFLDAIAALTDCYRSGATQSRVTATLTGADGTVVPAGVIARTSAGDDFYLENDVTLALDGKGTGVFLSMEKGPVPAPANSLNTIIDGILGWETVTNDLGAVLGADEQSDRDFRIMRYRTLFTGAGYTGAMESALWRVPNVTGVLVMDNRTNETVVKNDVSLKPHSVYAAVYGGADEDVALALYKTKTVGADYNGDTTVTVRDPSNGRSYTVVFQRPKEVDIEVTVTVEAASVVPNVKEAVKEAVLDYALGRLDNMKGLNIGADVSPFEIGGAVACRVPGIYVKSVAIARLNETPAKEEIAIKGDEIARIAAGAITVNLE